MTTTIWLILCFCCLIFSLAFCINQHTFNDGPSIVTKDYNVSDDVLTIFKASTTKSKDKDYPNTDLRAVIDILACCRTLEQRRAIADLYQKTYKKTILESLFPGKHTKDPNLKMYFEYMFYDSIEIMARAIYKSLGLKNDHAYRGIIATCNCDQMKAIHLKYENLFGKSLLEDLKERGRNDVSQRYYLDMANPKKICRPSDDATIDDNACQSDAQYAPTKQVDCSTLSYQFGNVLAYNSFAYIKKMINTYLYKNSYEVANLCTGNNTLDDAYVRIIYFAGKRTRYYALWELGALFNDKLPPVADALPRVYLMRSEVDLCGVRTEFWSLHNYTTIEDHYELLDKTQYSDLYIYALNQTLSGNRDTVDL